MFCKDSLKFFDPRADIEKYTSVLPHWEQPGASYFVTFRLADSLPKEKLEEWKYERDAWIEAHPKPWSEEVEKDFHERFSSTIEHWLDAGHGSCVLRDPSAARIVGDALNHFEGQRWESDGMCQSWANTISLAKQRIIKDMMSRPTLTSPC